MWEAANVRHKFSDIMDAALAGHPQFVKRHDGKEVAVVSRQYFDSTKGQHQDFPAERGLLLGRRGPVRCYPCRSGLIEAETSHGLAWVVRSGMRSRDTILFLTGLDARQS
jgi:hypothetical protein